MMIRWRVRIQHVLGQSDRTGQSWRSRLWPESGAMSPIPALDGLRAIAVLLVLVFHAWNDLPGYIQPGQNPYQYPLNYGRTGVDLFFVLSGFLLFLPYARWMFELQSRPSARLFYRRRLLRVGPAYWACLAICILAAPLTFAALGDAVVHVFFLANVSPRTTFSINGVFWTMAVEVQYYALLPLIGWIAVRLSRRWTPTRAAVGVAAVLVLISLCSDYLVKSARLANIPIVSSLLLGQYSLPFWLGIFGAGIACSIAYVYLTALWRPTDGAVLRAWGNRVLITGLAVGGGLVFVPGAYHIPGKDILFGAVYAAILFGVLFGSSRVSGLLQSRPLRFVGLISYSCYLWHAIVINQVEAWLPTALSTSEKVALACLIGGPLAIGAAYISYQLTERPFMRARKRAHEAFPRPAMPISPVEVVSSAASRA